VYKILVKAGEPLTVPQIAEQMSRGFLSAAMNQYREHKTETDPTWLDGKGDRWSPPAQREAMVWYVRRIMKSGRETKKFKVTTSDPRNWRVEGTYTPGKPPMVRRMVWTQKPRTVPWTLEDDQALNAGHGAGIQFMAEIDDFLARTKHPWDEARALFELAKRAIRPPDR
jgi:hypothetical protein